MALGQLVIDLNLNMAKFVSGIGQVNQRMNNFSRTIAGVQRAFLSLGAMYGVFRIFDSFIQSAREAELIEKKLAFAMESHGYSWDVARQAVTEFANTVQRTTRFSDEQAREALTNMFMYTSDFIKAQEGARLAMDLSIRAGMDMVTSSKYVGMAMAGNVEMLGRYIPEFRNLKDVLGENVSAADKAAYAFKVLTEKFGGTAQAELDTYDGRLQQFKNSWDDLKETLGLYLLPILKDVFADIKKIVDLMNTWVAPKPQEALGWLEKGLKDAEMQLAHAEKELGARKEGIWKHLTDIFDPKGAAQLRQRASDLAESIAWFRKEIAKELEKPKPGIEIKTDVFLISEKELKAAIAAQQEIIKLQKEGLSIGFQTYQDKLKILEIDTQIKLQAMEKYKGEKKYGEIVNQIQKNRLAMEEEIRTQEANRIRGLDLQIALTIANADKLRTSTESWEDALSDIPKGYAIIGDEMRKIDDWAVMTYRQELLSLQILETRIAREKELRDARVSLGWMRPAEAGLAGWEEEKKLLSERLNLEEQRLQRLHDMKAPLSDIYAQEDRIMMIKQQQAVLDQSRIRYISELAGAYEGFQSGLERYITQAGTSFTRLETMTQNIAKGMEQSFSNFFQSIFDNTKTWKEKMTGLFQDLADSFIKALSDMAAQWLVTQLVMQTGGGGKAKTNWVDVVMNVLGIVAGAGGGGGGWSAGYSSPGYGAGGYGGSWTAFQHGGMITEPIVGVGRSGRTYTFGEKEAELVTPESKLKQGADKRTPINIINVVDPRQMDQWAASATGQNAIINVIGSNIGTIQRLLR